VSLSSVAPFSCRPAPGSEKYFFAPARTDEKIAADSARQPNYKRSATLFCRDYALLA
jgi:hypothetical protein